jgi:hypothetical protein
VQGGITPTGTKNINSNGIHDVTNYASANVQVPNSYSASDEGKVVSSGALVSQTSRSVTDNGTYDTTTNNQVVVNVPSVTPTGTISITQNGTVDVTQYASANVNVSGGGGGVGQLVTDETVTITSTPTSKITIKRATFSNQIADGDIIFFRVTRDTPIANNFFDGVSICFASASGAYPYPPQSNHNLKDTQVPNQLSNYNIHHKPCKPMNNGKSWFCE